MMTASVLLLWAALILYGLHLFRGTPWTGWGGTVATAAAWASVTGVPVGAAGGAPAAGGR
jgi:hypothetical protein